MPPHASGNVVVKTLSDGTRVFKLRFRVQGQREMEVLHERRDCKCGCGGGWNERTAQIELENILAKVRAGVWRKREAARRAARHRGCPTFHEYASKWLENKKAGLLGDRPIGTNTEADYRSRLANHLLPFFGEYRAQRDHDRLTASSSRHTSSRNPRSCGARSRQARSCAIAGDGGSARSVQRRSES